jgi:hypothetical protein
MKYYRHGDLSFHPLEALPTSVEKVPARGDFVLARGEATGHAHRLVFEDRDVDIFMDVEGNYILNVIREAQLTHQEHKPITLSPGIYLQKSEQECDVFEGQRRMVMD